MKNLTVRRVEDYVNYSRGYIDGKHMDKSALKNLTATLDRDYSSLHKEIFNLSAGDWFMKAGDPHDTCYRNQAEYLGVLT